MNTLDARLGNCLWTRAAHLVALWRKRIRDRADLSAMSQRELQDIGFPAEGSSEAGESEPDFSPQSHSH